MNQDAVANAAAALALARGSHQPIDSLPEAHRPHNETQAYAVQRTLHRLLALHGDGRIVGHKIGCTTPVMQRYLGIDQPCAGGIFEPTAHHGHGDLRASDFVKVGVECEVAVRLSSDIDAAPASTERLADAVECVMAAIEIVDDRYRDYTSLGVMTLIADDFFNAGCVLGAPRHDWHGLDLAALSGRMWINGNVVGQGTGADIMNHPLNALAWLARLRIDLEQPLRAGEFVLLGSLVQTQWLAAGDAVRIEVSQLGEATVALS